MRPRWRHRGLPRRLPSRRHRFPLLERPRALVSCVVWVLAKPALPPTSLEQWFPLVEHHLLLPGRHPLLAPLTVPAKYQAWLLAKPALPQRYRVILERYAAPVAGMAWVLAKPAPPLLLQARQVLHRRHPHLLRQ